jgi:hypothetical protein
MLREILPLVLRQVLAIDSFGIDLRPCFSHDWRSDAAHSLVVAPQAFISLAIWALVRQLILVSNHSPCSYNELMLLSGPVVKDDLIQDQTPGLVVEMIDFD